MVSPQLLDQVAEDVRSHCAGKGYVGGPNWNPLTPRDSVAAFAMARLLSRPGQFDHYVAVAPEGHVYGYFFERQGIKVLSVFVDYPPRRAEPGKGICAIRGGRVLLIEDDVISGLSLRLVVEELARHGPRSLALYLGREKDDQQLPNVPAGIAPIYLAEDCLDPAERARHEAAFAEFFGRPCHG